MAELRSSVFEFQRLPGRKQMLRIQEPAAMTLPVQSLVVAKIV